MNMFERLTFSKAASSPALETGISIAIGPERSAVGNNCLWLHGAYQLTEDTATAIPATPLLGALVITWMSNGLSESKNLVGDVVLFQDDETLIDGKRIGYFNYDLTDWLNMYEASDYYITVSLGNYLSNTVSVRLNSISVPDD